MTGLPQTLAPYSKFIMAVLGVGLTYASTKYAGAAWLGPVVGVFASIGVYATPNTPPAPPGPTREASVPPHP